jgi:hypothetical protein
MVELQEDSRKHTTTTTATTTFAMYGPIASAPASSKKTVTDRRLVSVLRVRIRAMRSEINLEP